MWLNTCMEQICRVRKVLFLCSCSSKPDCTLKYHLSQVFRSSESVHRNLEIKESNYICLPLIVWPVGEYHGNPFLPHPLCVCVITLDLKPVFSPFSCNWGLTTTVPVSLLLWHSSLIRFSYSYCVNATHKIFVLRSYFVLLNSKPMRVAWFCLFFPYTVLLRVALSLV